MKHVSRLLVLPALLLRMGASGGPPASPGLDALQAQVREAETAFARSLAARDLGAFAAHVAEDAVFFGQGGKVQRGKAAIVAAWRPLFEMERPPFSWAPEQVEVLASGTLAHVGRDLPAGLDRA